MFWGLWLVGSLLNVLVISLPLLWVDGGSAMFSDVRFLVAIGILHLWIGCDHSVPAKNMAHYRDVRVQNHDSGWFPVACGLLILLNLWIAVFDGAANRSVNLNLVGTVSGGCVALVGLWLRFRPRVRTAWALIQPLWVWTQSADERVTTPKPQ